MYILAAQFVSVSTDGKVELTNQYFVAKTKTALKPIMADASDWRLNDGNGWCDSKYQDSWKVFDHVVGELCRYVI